MRFFLLPLLVVMILSSSAYAQLEKGSFLLGGNAGLSFNNQTIGNTMQYEVSEFSYSLSPNVGYLVAKGLAVGGLLSYSHTGSTYPRSLSIPSGGMDASSNNWTVGPSVQYFHSFGGKLALQVQTSFAWGRSSAEQAFYLSNPVFEEEEGQFVKFGIKSSQTTFTVGPGLTYFLNPHVGLQGNVFYKSSQLKPDSGSTFNSKTSTAGVYFQVGLQIFLGK